MSVNNYHTTSLNIPEERGSRQHRGESLKSRVIQKEFFLDPLILKMKTFGFETPENTTAVTHYLIPEDRVVSLLLLHTVTADTT
jgi:hypothetical protein